MPAITEKVVKKVYDSLIEYSYNKLGGSPATQQELLNTCEDIKGFCLEGKWNTLSQEYRQAWLGEIIRRVQRVVPTATTKIVDEPKLTQAGLINALRSDPALVPAVIDQIYFSQFGINRHFQGHYVGQPAWLSEAAAIHGNGSQISRPLLPRSLKQGIARWSSTPFVPSRWT